METIAVVFVCLVGSVYSFFLFQDCLKSWRKERVGTNSGPPRRQTRHARRASRYDWWSQAISAALFLGVAVALLTGSWQDLQRFADAPGDGDPSPWSVEVPGMSPVPKFSVLRHNARPGRPIWCVNLAFLPVTDADIHALVKAGSEIEILLLNGTNLTCKELAQLRQLPRLRILSLDATPITDSALKELAQIASLKELSLVDSQVTDEGLACLKKAPHLRKLSLGRTRITDFGCRHLAQIESLEELSLDDTKITDAGLEHLATSPRLRWLNLTGTAVTDSGAKFLQRLRRLEALIIYGTNVTDQGIRQLKEELPHLHCT